MPRRSVAAREDASTVLQDSFFLQRVPSEACLQMVLPELKRQVPLPRTKMPLGCPRPGMVTVVTVTFRVHIEHSAWRALADLT
jgi:hypothetical protein